MLHAPLATGTGTGRGTRAPWSCLSNCVCVCVFLNTFTTTAAHMGGGKGCNMLIPLRLLRQCQMSAHVICQAVLPPTPLQLRLQFRLEASSALGQCRLLWGQTTWQPCAVPGIDWFTSSLAHGMRRGNDDDNDIDMSSIMRWVTLGTLRLNENY